MTQLSGIYSKARGISLIEIIIAISILSIIMFIGVPSFQSFFERSRANAVSEGLITAIQMARSEAVMRSEPITLCLRVENAGVVGCAAGGTDWADGWVLMTSANEVIRDWRMRGNLSVDTSVTTLLFNNRGMLNPDTDIDFKVDGSSLDDQCFRVRKTGILTSIECT